MLSVFVVMVLLNEGKMLLVGSEESVSYQIGFVVGAAFTSTLIFVLSAWIARKVFGKKNEVVVIEPTKVEEVKVDEVK
jgi:hypothetical protein